MSKIVKFPGNFRNPDTKRPCSFSAISDKGNVVYGTAAFLVVAKRNGGINAYIASIATEAAKVALNSAINSEQQRKVS
jgi:hypothetical protein